MVTPLRPRDHIYCILLLIAIIPTSAGASNRFLFISGGGSPSGNHLSQYLQGKVLASFLQQRFGSENTDVFFAAGNSSTHPGLFPDVHASSVARGFEVDRMLYGVIPLNQPATKQNVTDYFIGNAPRSLTRNDTFFLIVADHGMPNKKSRYYDNNCISLWNYDDVHMKKGSWEQSCLSVKELKKLIHQHVRAKRTVFAMSQCFSGGFHQMSVGERRGYPKANVNLCGFTASTEDLPASGCMPDVNERNYEGYERYLAEHVTGRNILDASRAPKEHGRSLYDAHYAASLTDMTIDIPTTTSDYYLQQWYDTLIEEGRAPRTGGISSHELREVLDKVVSLKLSVGQLLPLAGDMKSLVEQRLAHLHDMVRAIGRHNPRIARLIRIGTREDLENHIEEVDGQVERIGTESSKTEEAYWQLRYELLFKPWQSALKQGTVETITEDEQARFENGFFADYESRLQGSKDSRTTLKAHFIQTLADTTHSDPELARHFAGYASLRDQKMYDWGLSTGDPGIAKAVVELRALAKKSSSLNDQSNALRREYSLVRRILHLRQQVAAIIALILMEDKEGLGELTGLVECEESPF